MRYVYDHDLRIHSKLSLCSGNTSMKMLAGEYNFSDISFFCRYFKQHTGMTPMQFVKSEAPKRT